MHSENLKGSTGGHTVPTDRKLVEHPIPNKDRLCKVQGCQLQVHARGLCSSHYTQWWKSPKTCGYDADYPRSADTTVQAVTLRLEPALARELTQRAEKAGMTLTQMLLLVCEEFVK